jgi:uncharacterized protein YbaR (Trm112 family)
MNRVQLIEPEVMACPGCGGQVLAVSQDCTAGELCEVRGITAQSWPSGAADLSALDWAHMDCSAHCGMTAKLAARAERLKYQVIVEVPWLDREAGAPMLQPSRLCETVGDPD